jgi:ADP-ribose pyrophosphatase YjhB (NUDIX family)
MKTKILNIAIIERNDKVLLREKPAGKPYAEKMYLFGGEVTPEISAEEATRAIVKKQAGVDIRARRKIGWDTEIKIDNDGERKLFVYLNTIYDYAGGELMPGDGVVNVKWVSREDLAKEDLNPSARKVFEELGHIEKGAK